MARRAPAAEQQAWLCETLHAAAPLADHVHSLATDWAAPKQRKGAQVPPQLARKALCDHKGGMCHLFQTPKDTLQHMQKKIKHRPLRALSIGKQIPHAQNLLAEKLTASGVWNVSTTTPTSRPPHVLLVASDARVADLDKWLLPVLEVTHTPPLVFVFSNSERSARQWNVSGWPLSSMGYSTPFLLPGEKSDQEITAAIQASIDSEKQKRKEERKTSMKASSSKMSTKRKKKPRAPTANVGDPLHDIAMIWRTKWGTTHQEACVPPMFALSNTQHADDAGCLACGGVESIPEVAAAAAMKSAASAASAGIPFSEWLVEGARISCRTPIFPVCLVQTGRPRGVLATKNTRAHSIRDKL